MLHVRLVTRGILRRVVSKTTLLPRFDSRRRYVDGVCPCRQKNATESSPLFMSACLVLLSISRRLSKPSMVAESVDRTHDSQRARAPNCATNNIKVEIRPSCEGKVFYCPRFVQHLDGTKCFALTLLSPPSNDLAFAPIFSLRTPSTPPPTAMTRMLLASCTSPSLRARTR